MASIPDAAAWVVEPLLTAEEAAAALHVSTSMVYTMRRRGELPGVQIGSLWRWNAEVIRAVQRGETPPSGGGTVVPLPARPLAPHRPGIAPPERTSRAW